MKEKMLEKRRTFLKKLSVGVGSALGAVFALPWLAYFLDPLVRRKQALTPWIKVARLQELDSTPKPFVVVAEQRDAWIAYREQKLGTVWLRQNKTGQLHALSAECPHLGCKIGLSKDKKGFSCPCHESAFALDGKVLSGPSPRSLDELQVRIRDKQVEVQFKRFALQSSEKIELES